jgi:hypothetical protein
MTPESSKFVHPHIQAEIYYLTHEEGGISVPVSSGYGGQFYFNLTNWDAQQQFIGKSICQPGESVEVLIQFATAHLLLPFFRGLKFEMREGNKTLGRGTVTEIFDSEIKYESSKLYKAIDELLSTEWDPIGINDCQGPRDEYRSYIPQIYKLKVQGLDRELLAKYLFKIETDTMGLSGNIHLCRQIADKILKL